MLLGQANKFLVVIIYVNLYLSCTVAVKLTVKIINFEYGNKLLIDRRHYASPGMVFGQCDSTDGFVDKRLCTFVLETDKSVDSADHLRICDIQLVAKDNHKPIGKIHRLIGFGGSKSILIYEEQYEYCYKIAILDFNGCQVYYGDTGDMCTYDPDVASVRDDALIDFIERDNSRSLCKGVKYCRMVMDAEGNVVLPLSQWKIVQGKILSMIYSPTHGRLIVEKSEDNTIQVRAIGADNEGRFPTSIIKEYHYPSNISLKIATSNTQEHLSVCQETNSWSRHSDTSLCFCSQFNKHGILMFEMSQTFTVGIGSMSVHNLPYGGILLLIKPCKLRSSGGCTRWQDNTFIVTKIDRSGEVVGSLGISQFRFDEGITTHHLNFFVNELEQYCLSAVQRDENEELRVKMTIVCFGVDEMKVSDRWTSEMSIFK